MRLTVQIILITSLLLALTLPAVAADQYVTITEPVSGGPYWIDFDWPDKGRVCKIHNVHGRASTPYVQVLHGVNGETPTTSPYRIPVRDGQWRWEDPADNVPRAIAIDTVCSYSMTVVGLDHRFEEVTRKRVTFEVKALDRVDPMAKTVVELGLWTWIGGGLVILLVLFLRLWPRCLKYPGLPAEIIAGKPFPAVKPEWDGVHWWVGNFAEHGATFLADHGLRVDRPTGIMTSPIVPTIPDGRDRDEEVVHLHARPRLRIHFPMLVRRPIVRYPATTLSAAVTQTAELVPTLNEIGAGEVTRADWDGGTLPAGLTVQPDGKLVWAPTAVASQSGQLRLGNAQVWSTAVSLTLSGKLGISVRGKLEGVEDTSVMTTIVVDGLPASETWTCVAQTEPILGVGLVDNQVRGTITGSGSGEFVVDVFRETGDEFIGRVAIPFKFSAKGKEPAKAEKKGKKGEETDE